MALRLLRKADACLESNRPGVMERLGLGPEECLAVNPRLVYARATGWGQDGPLSPTVGHDLNYLALSGLLSMIGPAGGPPSIPLNLLGDYAGGGLYLALGVLAAIIETRVSGQGQVVDAAMIDGIGSLMTHQFGFLGSGRWLPERGMNFLDGGAPWYNVYETADGGYVSVAPIEAKFYANFLAVLGLNPAELPDQLDRDSWPELRSRFAAIFREHTRDEWCARFAGVEACFAPVLSVAEAVAHSHQSARGGPALQPHAGPRALPAPSAGKRHLRGVAGLGVYRPGNRRPARRQRDRVKQQVAPCVQDGSGDDPDRGRLMEAGQLLSGCSLGAFFLDSAARTRSSVERIDGVRPVTEERLHPAPPPA